MASLPLRHPSGLMPSPYAGFPASCPFFFSLFSFEKYFGEGGYNEREERTGFIHLKTNSYGTSDQ
jgi:hypothetical protein